MNTKQHRLFSKSAGFWLLIAALCSCSYSYKFTVTPADAILEVEGAQRTDSGKYTTKLTTINITARREGYVDFRETFSHKDFFKTRTVTITLEKRRYMVNIETADVPSEYNIDNTYKGTTPVSLLLTHGKHSLVLTRDQYAPQTIELDITQAARFVFRHQKEDPGLKPVGVFSCGRQPKQLNFSPDNRYIYITLLDDYGFQVFDVEKREMTETVTVGTDSRKKGFVEGLFIPAFDSYLVTQMQTDSLFEYNTEIPHQLKRKIPSGGRWPKVIAYCPQLDLLAVSNWVSNTVVLIDYRSGKAVHKITDLNTPRGVAFTHDGRYIVICSFDGGFIKKFSTADWQEQGHIARNYAAMRHVVMARDDKSCWVSDMGRSAVYGIDMETFRIRKEYKTFHITNTALQ